MFKKVAFTMYPIKDVARARAFYEHTLGLKVGLAGGQGDMHWIEYDLPGGGCLALTNTTGAEPSSTSSATVPPEVEDLIGLLEALPYESNVRTSMVVLAARPPSNAVRVWLAAVSTYRA